MKDKPPPESIQRTAALMRELLAVPKQEMTAAEKKWKRAKPKRVQRGRASA